MSSKLPHGMRNDLYLCGASVSCVCFALEQGGLDHGIPLWVECHSCDRRPVPGLTTPASRVVRARLLIECVAASEQRAILPSMALSRGDIADATVMMRMVVPVHERRGPLPGSIEVSEALGREGGAILGGAEERLDEGIVVADPRAGIGRPDAEPGEHGEHGGGLQGWPVVAVQHRLGVAGMHALGQ